ncbi:hypothetical protein PhCBS80983_g00134 [Powellomyces hirtus]|uniref:SET domain-containing protein n=1 Tax=Powellomyces hirtus TaxID=109895 RepID=A0A507EGQ9_9FUNG|nr:hypothetical protein PhCBS80983_g00134 [Powellomyces hirtus]
MHATSPTEDAAASAISDNVNFKRPNPTKIELDHCKKVKLVDELAPQAIAVQNLLSWAKANGADVGTLEFRETVNAEDPLCTTRAAFSLRSIDANTPIARIPASLVLSETTARTSPLGVRLDAYLRKHSAVLTQQGKDPYAPGLILLSAFMAYERFENPDSFWKPYLEALPERYELPLWWSEDEVHRLLGGSNLRHIVEERKKLLNKGLDMIKEACGDLFVQGTMCWENLLWAYSAISSRAFPRARPATVDEREHAAEEAMEISSGASELCLYPVLDMLNHQRGKRIEWRIEEGVAVTFITLEDVVAGIEVFNNYGAKGNENLLGNYGFVLDPNPEDYVKVALNIHDASDPCAAQKRQSLSRITPNRLVHLLFDGENETKLPADLMAVTRLLVMNANELKTDLGSGEVLKSPLGGRNEVVALSTLWHLIKRKASELQQEVHSSGHETDRERMVRIYRDGQARILKHNMSLCSAAVTSFLQSSIDVNYPPSSCAQLLLTADSDALPTCFRYWIETLLSDLNETDMEYFDEDTILCLALIHERTRGDTSPWGSVIGKMRTNASDLVRDQAEDILMHFKEAVQPTLHGKEASKCSCGTTYSSERFLWAASVLETHSVNVPEGLTPLLEGFGVLMIP